MIWGKQSKQSTRVYYKRASHFQSATSFQSTPSTKTLKMGDKIPKITPTFCYVGDRDLNSLAANAARLRLDSHTVQFYDFYNEIYQRGRVVPTFRQELSQAQERYLILVSNITDWIDSDDAVAFQQEVDLYGFMSFDLERYQVDKDAVGRVPLFKRRRVYQDRTVYAVFGTLTGRVAIFDLESCYGGPVRPEDPLETLPSEFKAWIRSPDVILAGSGIDGDILETGLDAQKVLNTQDLFAKHMSSTEGSPPLINVGSTRRSGMGIQAYYAKGVDYKPMAARKFVTDYGMHKYRDNNGRLKWPAWRHHDFLYKWYKNKEGQLRSESLFYMWHDGSTPSSLVAKIFLDSCQRTPILVREAKVAEHLQNFLGPNFQRVGAPDVLHIDAPELVRELDAEGEEAGAQNRRGEALEVQPTNNKQVSQGRINNPNERLTTAFVSQRATQEKEEGELSDDECKVVDIQPPEKIVREGKPREGAVFSYWDWRRERENPYVANPGLARLCVYCAKGKHSYKHKSGAIMCEAALEDEPHTDICTYVRCKDRAAHRIAACKMLHHRCGICNHRGHDEEDRCWSWDDRDWKKARDDFEMYADFGVYTTSRRRDEQWGFWAHLRESPFPYFASYPELLKMSVAEVDEALGLRPKIPRFVHGRGVTVHYVDRKRGGGRRGRSGDRKWGKE